MNHIFYTKTSDFKIFGKTIFSKTDVYNETEHDSEYTIIVKPDYFNSEFDLDLEKKKKQNGKNK